MLAEYPVVVADWFRRVGVAEMSIKSFLTSIMPAPIRDGIYNRNLYKTGEANRSVKVGFQPEMTDEEAARFYSNGTPSDFNADQKRAGMKWYKIGGDE